MYRVTTPKHTFILPFGADAIDRLIITYSQDGQTILEKTEGDCNFTENRVELTLTQEETMMFSGKKALVQMRVRIGSRVLASNILSIYVLDVLNEEVM